MSDVLLEARKITMQFGGLKAVDSLEFKIMKGQLAGLIGPNGAGKTTVFNMLTGVYQPTQGEVVLEGQSLKGLKPFQISHRGVARTFQNIRLFKNLSVLDNVLVATHQHVHYGLFDSLLKTKNFQDTEKHLHNKAMELLQIFALEAKAHEPASSLPYGQQRKLEIVRALATEPKILLLDEPAAGMNHSETHHLMETIAKIREQFKLTVLLIEHDMKLVMGICENIVVLDHGTKIEEGNPAVVQNSQKVIEAYLGVEESE
ncbi:ABC transporter ATP-binding protein [Bdellovibrio svalbardensis]|uniref:ABC transporter ATP-binding protein n=1 Tax=Bdellovibrio svalbardensis TaxID=2972972 RepID=A0ABT6DEV5_9BACT|nr:ABC transporter ATP-binding protein [Bdellovibrio svalbardensis]MDG0815369.1 ABC transporter ATP-binding protein [Bdellovibrio svalbardensis]